MKHKHLTLGYFKMGVTANISEDNITEYRGGEVLTRGMHSVECK